MDLTDLLQELLPAADAWRARTGLAQEPWESLYSLSEEVGELSRAVLKRWQNIRGTQQQWTAEVHKELADVVLSFLVGSLNAGWPLPTPVVVQYLMDKAEPLPQMMTGLGLLAQDAQTKGEEGVNRLFAGVYALVTQEELDLEALVRERAAHVFPRDVHHDSLS